MTAGDDVRRRMGRPLRVAAAAALALATAAVAPSAAMPAAAAAPADHTEVRMMAINGFEGNLRPPGDTGGAGYLSSYLDQLRGAADASLLFSTGDNVGDTPFESAYFHDEPSIEFLNSQGLTASAIGNHDLDHGFAELRQLQTGGCHPVDGCRFTPQFSGAAFPMVGSNLKLDSGLPATLPFAVSYAGSTPVGTIAITQKDLATRVAPAGIADVTVADPLQTINRTAELLRFLGVRAIVLLMHEDLEVPADTADGCARATGPARPIIDNASPAVDIIFTGGSSQSFACTFLDPDNRPRTVVQATPGGTGVAVADVTIDPATGDVLRDRVSAFNQVVRHDISPDPAAVALVDRATAMAAENGRRTVGAAPVALTRKTDAAGESTLGELIADAQLAATRGAGAQVALTNPGGIRADLPAGRITYSDVFSAQPFRNRLHTLTLTGAQLDAALEQQFRPAGGDDPDGNGRTRIVLQPSAGLTYTVDPAAPLGHRVSDIRLHGTVLPADAPIRVTVNAFLAEGGDGFSAFTLGTDPVIGVLDTEALADHLHGRSPVTPPDRDRITVR
ncbi:bifunctional UDP-sugar hydrolase/5'-nucleotidase [Tomitella cavernea]|uniref:Bifunctional metallophosphatase/5'-nucleotidase n=1 Tax=Tomitella cavernea TaxID=1387982 RepID=A0ABP9C9B5_9ACTN